MVNAPLPRRRKRASAASVPAAMPVLGLCVQAGPLVQLPQI